MAVGGVSFFGGNDFGGGGNTKNMAVYRHITGTAHQGGNFMAGKLPKTTLKQRGKIWSKVLRLERPKTRPLLLSKNFPPDFPHFLTGKSAKRGRRGNISSSGNVTEGKNSGALASISIPHLRKSMRKIRKFTYSYVGQKKAIITALTLMSIKTRPYNVPSDVNVNKYMEDNVAHVIPAIEKSDLDQVSSRKRPRSRDEVHLSVR